MAICLIIVFAVFMSASSSSTFYDEVGKKLAQTFLPVNIIDGMFWLWGLATLKLHRGDVRDGIIGDEKDNSDHMNDLDNYAEQNIGTIH